MNYFLFFYFLKFILTSNLSAHYYISIDGLSFSMNVGGKTVTFDLVLDNEVSYIVKDYYGKEDFKVVGNQVIEIKNQLVKAEKCRGNVTFPEKNFTMFYFYCIESNDKKFIHHVAGFPYLFDDYQNSIIHNMRSEDLIQTRALCLSRQSFDDDGSIYFGEFPQSFKGEHITSCNAVNSKGWGCMIDYFYVGDDINNGFQINQVGKFSTSTKMVLAPRNVFDHLVESVFDSFIKENYCRHSSDLHVHRIECNCDFIKGFPKVSFAINKNIYHFKEYEAFVIDYMTCYFFIGKRAEGERDDYWTLGTGFFKDFSIQLNYDKGKVFFYSPKRRVEEIDVIEVISRKIRYRKNLLVLATIIMSIQLAFLLKIKFNNI